MSLPVPHSEGAARSSLNSAFWCCFYGGGIVGMLLIYGLLQERIMSEPYGNDYFSISVFLVFCNRAIAVMFATVMICFHQESAAHAAPLWKYLAISLSNVGASYCQYEALRYVCFPVQMLGKSFKMMPVMLWGIAIAGKRYGKLDWLVAFLVTGGVTEFLMTGTISSKHQSGTSAHGIALLVLFLALDGFTSTFQEMLFREHKTSKYNQMLYVNTFSGLVSFITLAASRNIGTAFGFCGQHPRFVADAFFLSASAVGGQWFIYSQVKEFGALVFAATMNLRQVVSILVSYVTYKHQISALQIIGLVLVFAGLFCKSTSGLLGEHMRKQLQEGKPLLDDTEAGKQKQADPEGKVA
mmetsp:Transcript_93932/g.210478  ORF Transcript_93932/g.210478 Transcript_93932/m.210478 type:complete len:354 (-) Transcript_93932:63-1124(-)